MQFFFKNKQGEIVTVNSYRYRAMLNELLFTKIEEEDIGNIWFQQDSATCYTAEATLDVLRPGFDDRIISRRADVVWPPWSCDLTPLDYYLWGTIKDKCYHSRNKHKLKKNRWMVDPTFYWTTIFSSIDKLV